MSSISTQNYFPGATRITVERYHRMIARGILEEGAPVELLDGFLVLKDRSKAGEDPMSIGTAHASAVDNLTELAGVIRACGCRLRIQQPLDLPPDDVPEPDAAIVVEAEHRYREHHPTIGEIHCVVEVSDSSLEHDRTTKKLAYAAAGIPQYVIVNLVDGCVEVYRATAAIGSYAPPIILHSGQTVEFSCGVGRGIEVPVSRLLP